MAGVIRDLKLSISGTNYRLIHRWIEEVNIDTSHWKGQAHGTTISKLKVPLSEILQKDSPYRFDRKRKTLLVKTGLLKNECQICKGGPEWNDGELVLRLDHINGDRFDNRIGNLRFLCPNCDSRTSTYCGRNKKT